MKPITVRQARLVDVPAMLVVLEPYIQAGEILPRTEEDIYRSLREWAVAESGGRIVGVGSLLIMWRDLGEIRSLVIDPAYQGQGIGRRLIEHLVAEARALELPRLFALTRKPGFFLKLGFQLTRLNELPRKVQRDCVFCPKFHACDEVAMVMPLEPVIASPNGKDHRATLMQK